jgi:signal peptidase I
MSSQWKSKLCMYLRGWGYSIIITILIATSFRSAIADWNDIPSGSMKPTILEGDRVFVNKLAYDLKLPYTTYHLACWDSPVRGDIVVFYSPGDGKRLIKRVMGVPGDVIAMYRNQVIVNGEALQYTGLDRETINRMPPELACCHIFLTENLKGKKHSIMLSPSRPWPSMHSFGPITMPKGKYFMMGDNRDNSADSRFFGFVDRKLILGRATAVAISREGSFFHPRWNRFFKDLS